MSEIVVERHSFFKGPKEGPPHLRFSESSPMKEYCDHRMCNCTKAVVLRPEGIPTSVVQDVCVTEDDGKMFWKFDLRDNWLTFRWGEPNGKAHVLNNENSCRPFEPHAYVQFGHGGGLPAADDSCLKAFVGIAEVCEDWYKPKSDFQNKTFFANLFLGNEIDVSQLMNGHAPSLVVDLSKIGPDDLWMYNCNWGKEAMDFLTGSEAAIWKAAIRDSRQLWKESRQYVQMLDSTVADVRDQAKTNYALSGYAQRIKDSVQPFLIGMEAIRKTELYHLCMKLKDA